MFHVKHSILPAGLQLPIDVSRETLERLDLFVALLLRWNRTINLISRADEAIVWQRHIADCLALVPLLPANFARALDLGSGGGMPGLVLAIATGRSFGLIEADGRKAAFLREAARETSTQIDIYPIRVETARLRPADVITARALAPLNSLLHLARPLLADGGICIFPKGRSAAKECGEARMEWDMEIEMFPSFTDASATILRIAAISPISRRREASGA